MGRLVSHSARQARSATQGLEPAQQDHKEVAPVRRLDLVPDLNYRESAVGLSPQSDDPSSCQRFPCPRCVR